MFSSANKDAIPDFVPPKHLQTLHRTILHHFIEMGQAPSLADLALVLTCSPFEVEAMLTELAAKCLYRDRASGEILAAYPFSAPPTSHRLGLLNGREVFAMCAIDALGISAMLDQPVMIHSHCVQCGAPILLEVQDERLATIQPPSVVVWYQSAAADCVPAVAKCPGINFFCQAAHRVAWSNAHLDSEGDELTLATALERGAKIFRYLLRD